MSLYNAKMVSLKDKIQNVKEKIPEIPLTKEEKREEKQGKKVVIKNLKGKK